MLPESNVLKVQVYRIGVSKKDLNDAITAAETFFEENEINKIDFIQQHGTMYMPAIQEH